MMSTKYDITVAYRIYPHVSHEPAIHSDDKYKLSEQCLRSFKSALGILKAKIIVLLDGCPQTYDELFKKYFPIDDLELIHYDRIGNRETFKQQIELLLSQNYSEIIYFAEDDYIYVPFAIQRMVEFLVNNNNVDFVSAYDHYNLYNYQLHDHKNYIRVYGNTHWRTASSTCLTFLTSQGTLKNTKNVFLSYSNGNHDNSLWLALTKHQINPLKCKVAILCKMSLAKIIRRAWYYCWGNILFGKERYLWIPIPSLGTHLEKKYLAPVVEWEKYFDI